jgi:S-adenosylmethionine:tRNA ribosyltransferase-isomerase
VRLEELDFVIPEGLIAQRPAEPRDSCRLMYLAADGRHRHSRFSALPELLRAGDTLVFNDSRVLPARLRALKPTGGAVELLFLRPAPGESGGGERWELLARPSNRLKIGGELVLPGGQEVVLADSLGEGRWLVQAPPGCSLVTVMEAHGRLPLPPYIKSYPEEPSSYQTVYASQPGSAAAPTAGLHFTPELLRRLQDAGMKAVFVTLHVGLDTFQPIREARVEDHRIHREAYSVAAGAMQAIRGAVASGSRLVAVGTTATRVLETLAQDGFLAEAPDPAPPSAVPLTPVPSAAQPGREDEAGVSGSTQIFITPGYRFRAVSALLTNFHLPRSSVLALTMAFAGPDRLRASYAEAIALGYRFFSFGDAMLIDRPAGP